MSFKLKCDQSKPIRRKIKIQRKKNQLNPTYLVREKSQIPSENTIFAESVQWTPKSMLMPFSFMTHTIPQRYKLRLKLKLRKKIGHTIFSSSHMFLGGKAVQKTMDCEINSRKTAQCIAMATFIILSSEL